MRKIEPEFDRRNPATWPDMCRVTRDHPLTRQHQRCMRLAHQEGPHTWETP